MYQGLDGFLFQNFYYDFINAIREDPDFENRKSINFVLTYIYQLILLELTKYNGISLFGVDFWEELEECNLYNNIVNFRREAIELGLRCLRKLAQNIHVKMHEILFPLLYFREFDITSKLLLKKQTREDERARYQAKCYSHINEQNCTCLIGEVYKNFVTNLKSSKPSSDVPHILKCNLCFLAYAICYPGQISGGKWGVDCNFDTSGFILTCKLTLRYIAKKSRINCECVHNLLSLSFYFPDIIAFNTIHFIISNLDFQTHVCCVWKFVDFYNCYVSKIEHQRAEDSYIVLIFRELIKKLRKKQESFSVLEQTQFNYAIYKMNGRYQYLKILADYQVDLSKIIYRTRNLFCVKTLCLNSEYDLRGARPRALNHRYIFNLIKSNIDLLLKNRVDMNLRHGIDLLTFCVINDDTFTAVYLISKGIVINDLSIENTFNFRQLIRGGSYHSDFVYNFILKTQSFDQAIGKYISHLQISTIYSNWVMIYVLLYITRIKKNARFIELLRYIKTQVIFFRSCISSRKNIPYTNLFLSDLQTLIDSYLIGAQSLKQMSLISLRDYLSKTNFHASLNAMKLPKVFKDQIRCKSILEICPRLALEGRLKVLPNVKKYENISEI